MFSPFRFIKKIGPGVITGASDDDPSGIATYSQTGARFGYGLLWLSLFSTPLMYAAQEMSARLGMVTGRGLAGILRRHVSVRVVIVLSFLLFIVNTVNIGADLGAMAEAMRLLIPLPNWFFLVFFTALIVLLEIVMSYKRYVNVLRWLTFSLFSYVVASFFVHQSWTSVALNTLVPHMAWSTETIMIIVAVLGTTISPYCFFWQTSEEVEEEIAKGRRSVRKRIGATKKEVQTMRGDVATGMLLSNIVMFFIIITTAATLHRAGITDITTAAQAAEALRPLAGNFTFILFTIGIIGTGLLAIPILAGSASYAMAEVFGWKEGLSKDYKHAHAFYLVIVVAVVLGMFMNAFGVAPMQFLVFSAVLNGLLAPVMLWFIVRLADRRDVVGAHVNTPGIRLFGWLAFGLMALAGILLIIKILWP